MSHCFAGIIIFYELWMRGTLEYDGTRNPPETRVFHTGGQYNPAPTQMPPENALIPPLTNYTLGGLEPFTIYEFQVFVKLNLDSFYHMTVKLQLNLS